MTSRLSTVEPGQIIFTADGSAFRVKGKTASASGGRFSLTNISGSRRLVISSDDLVQRGILSPRMVRIAANFAMIAYGRDWDRVVKEAIVEAGYPVDTGFNWNSWFRKKFYSRMLGSGTVAGDDEDIVDESIQHVLVQELYDRHALSKFDPNKAPEDVKKQPLDKQVTWYLTWIIGGRLEDAVAFTNKQYGWKKNKDQDSPSQYHSQLYQEKEGEEGTEFNILDTEEHAQGEKSFDEVEEEDELAALRDEFFMFCKEVRSEKIANVMVKIFDYIVASEHGKKVEFQDIFKRDTGLGADRLKQLYKEFSNLMMEFADQFSENSPAYGLISMIKNFSSKKRQPQPAKASSVNALISSLKTADFNQLSPAHPTPDAAPQNIQQPEEEGTKPDEDEDNKNQLPRTTVPPELPNQMLHTSLNASKKENTMPAIKTQASREEVLKQIQARKSARAAEAAKVDAPHKLAQIAAREPKDLEMKAALTELANFFGSIRASFLNMRDNFNLSDVPKAASLKDKIAAKRNFASGLRRVAEENPQQFGDALSEVYGLLDEAAGAIENLAENSGVELCEEGPVASEEGSEEIVPAEEPEVKEASGTDAFVSPQDEVEKKFATRK